MASQNVLNLVDMFMVGRLGNEALAAVGIASFANFCAAAPILGVSAGVQAMASRRLGEGRDRELAAPLNGGLLLVLLSSVPWGALLWRAAPGAFPWLNSDPAVLALGVPYLQYRLCAMPAQGANFAFRGYWNATHQSRLYMRTLVTMHIANVFFNWVFIFGQLGMPAMGAPGAGLGSALATYIGTVQYFALGQKHARDAGFLRCRPDRQTLATMVRVSLPAGAQQLFFAAGMTIFYWIAGRVSTETLAAANVILNLMLVALLPSMALGMAAATLVGEALGRADAPDARAWGWDVVKVALAVSGVLALPALVAPKLLLSAFLEDGHTLELAAFPFRVGALSLLLDAIGMVLLHSVQGGAGASRLALVVSVSLQWLVGLPGAYLLGPALGGGLLGLFTAQTGYRGLQACVLARIWSRESWTNVRV